MPLNKAKGRMFQSVGWTWTVVRGCCHGCGVDYVMKGVEGELYPIKREIFEKTHEILEEP